MADTTKLDVVAAHIKTSLQMMAIGADTLSTNVVVMACEEIVLSLCHGKNVLVDWDYKVHVKDEYHKEFRELYRRAYNYAKHADRDAGVNYSGPPLDQLARLNETQTLLNIDGYRKLGGLPSKAMVGFASLLSIKYPAYFKPLPPDTYPGLEKNIADRRRDYESDPEIWILALRSFLFQEGVLPKVPSV